MVKDRPLFFLRNQLKISQKKLADKLSEIEKGVNFSQTSIALYELGLRTPSLKRAKIIANYFGLPVEAIIFGPFDCNLKSNDLKQTGTE